MTHSLPTRRSAKLYARNALAWVPQVDVGTRAWAILAVGSPRALDGMGAGRIGTFANDDDSADQLRSKLLLAGLAGLGRLDAGDASSAAASPGVDLGRPRGGRQGGGLGDRGSERVGRGGGRS